MRFERVHAEAFGGLVDAELTLAPGLTVVWGANEAGKSTWLAALFTALCGQRRGPGKTREQRELEQRHRPWGGDAWRVAAEVSLADGRRLELRHDLDDPSRSRVVDIERGHDLTRSLLFDGGPDGAQLLGLSRTTVPHTLVVRQADLLATTEGAGELQHVLQQAAATGADAATADEALARISDFQSKRVGTERAPTRPLAKALAHRDQRRAERAEAAEQQRTFLELGARRDAAEHARQQAQATSDRLRAEQQRRHVQARAAQLAEAEDLAAALPEDAPPDPAAEDDLAEAVATARSRWEARPPAPEPLEGRDAAALRAELAELPEAPEGDTEPDPSVEQAATDHAYAARRLDEHGAQRPEPGGAAPVDADPAALRETAAILERPLPEVPADVAERVRTLQTARTRAQRRRRTLAGAAGAVAVLGVALAAAPLGALAPALAGVVAVGLAVAAALAGRDDGAAGELDDARAALAAARARVAEASEARQAAEERAAAWQLSADPQRLREVADEVEAARRAAQEHAEWERTEAGLAAARERAEAGLREALAGRGVSAAHDPERPVTALLEEYRAGCRTRAEQARQAAHRDTLAQRVATREDAERRARAQRQARAEAAAALCAAAADVARASESPGAVPEALAACPEATDADEPHPVDEQALTAVHEALGAWLEAHQERRRARTEQQRRADRLGWLLGEGTLADLRAEVDAARTELDRLLAAVPGGAESLDDLADLDDATLASELARAKEDLDAQRSEVRSLERERDRLAASLPPLAEAEESLAEAEAEVARLRELDRVLGLARDHLRAASDRVNRSIAPRLKASVERALPRITGGRYREAAVDPETLQVTVATPEHGWQRADLLSHGTAEQLYLLLRVALAEHVATTDEPAPLLLDDPTAHSDDERTGAILALLDELAQDRQVVLMSQEEAVRAWARDHLSGPAHRLVELEPVAGHSVST